MEFVSAAMQLWPKWAPWILLAAVVLFVLELLRRAVLALDGMRRDLAEMKKDVPGMKAELAKLAQRMDQTRRWAQESIRRCDATDKAVATLTEAVIETPERVVELLRARRG